MALNILLTALAVAPVGLAILVVELYWPEPPGERPHLKISKARVPSVLPSNTNA